MIISVVCPGCRTTYRVQDLLRGKPMRCLTPMCRRVFIIDDAPQPTAPPSTSAPPTQSGSVGDMIPLLPVEEVRPDGPTPQVAEFLDFLPAEEVAPELPLERTRPDSAIPAPDWRTDAPPPRRNKQPDPSEDTFPPPRKPRSSPTTMESPKVEYEYEAGAWEAPPVRREPAEENGVEPLEEVAPETVPASDHGEYLPPRPPSRWAKWVILPFAVLTIGALGFGVYVLYLNIRDTEAKLAQRADAEFDKGVFANASELYEQLLKKYGTTSDQVKRYEFRRDYSNLRQRLNDPTDDLLDELAHAGQFYQERAADPELAEHAAALNAALAKVLTDFAERAAKDVKDEKALKTLAEADKVVAQVKAIKLADGSKSPDWSKMEGAFRNLRDAVARMNERKAILGTLRAKAKVPSYAGILDVENYLKEIAARFPELPGSDEVRQLREEQFAGHRATVVYDDKPLQSKRTARADDDEPAILFDPLLQGMPGAPRNDIALALVRGVLYGVSAGSGEIRWARRVGIDSTTLPVRVRARAGIQELVLVLSSDNATLTAVDLNGDQQWRYQLDRAVLGRPVIVDQRAYLATYSGEVHEIELSKGKLLGRYNLGQRLALGGTVETDPRTKTSRIYFPADDGCVYVLDVANRKCEQILYSRHPAGSLRGEPIVVPSTGDDVPGFLILNQATGLDGVQLRVFDLPVTSTSRERSLKPPPTLEGWTWFDPHHDPEKVILLSDAGRMGMFGIRQAHNNDQALFPLLPGGGINLASLLFPGGKPPARSRGRSEIVQVQGDEMWVLASDRLQRLRLAWAQNIGPKIVAVWPNSLEVGSPLHATQVLEDATGRQTLVTVTQPPARSCAWITCCDDETGQLLWRRQLGLVCQEEPLALPVNGGPPLLLALDQASSLFALDPARFVVPQGATWLSDSRNILLAGSLADNPDQPAIVIPDAEGKSAYVLIFPGTGREMIVRHVKPGNGREFEVSEGKVGLLAPLAGKPALVGSHLMLPLSDGTLARLAVPLQANPQPPEGGPNWRADRVNPETRCPIVSLGGDRFVTTDGVRGLAVWEWPPAVNVWTPLPPGRDDGATLELPDRIVDFVLVPGKQPHLAVSDTAGNLTLVEVKANGALESKRTWKLGGPITTGPFVRATANGVRIACVVDRSRLVWIDPVVGDKPLWTYKTPRDDGVVGMPQVIDGLLIVADQSGLYVAIDPNTGKTVGDGYQLRGSLAPATSPVPFQKDRLLAPLSDGTVMLLDPAKLRSRRPVPPDGR